MEVESAADMQVFRQRLQHASHHTGAHPLLEATMTGLVGRMALRQIRPGSAGTQDIQHAVQHIPARTPWTATTIRSPFRFRDELIQNVPLGVGEITKRSRHLVEICRSLPARHEI